MYDKLPLELQQKILSYAYNIQPAALRRDIVDIYNFKQRTLEYYYNYWIILMEEQYLEDRYWLLNDLYRYLNGDIGFTNGFANILQRLYLLRSESLDRTKERIDKLIISETSLKLINVFSGVMSVDERQLFLEYFVYTEAEAEAEAEAEDRI
jgi:hypothetical protein